jgi:TRAP-type C4-dicarboxylate transport system substrate-binding protein
MRSLAGIGAAALAAAILLTATACASSTKAGGAVTHQITIVMEASDAPDTDANSTYFISQVKKRSDGLIRIVLDSSRYSSADIRNEPRLVRALRSGKVQMAYVPARAWEEASPVTAFRALQAPLLVTNYPLLRRIVTGPIGRSMLTSLRSIGVVGLGLVPERLRRLFGRRPLDSASTLRGARIRPITSPTGELALRALGIVPVPIAAARAAGPAMRGGQIDGVESETISIENNDYMSYAHDLTANIALFAKATTIAINKSVFDRLSTRDRSILRAAARATVAHADPAAAERADMQELCRQKIRLVNATPGDLGSLEPLARRAYATLARDATTRREIQAIEHLEQAAPTRVSDVPACSARTRTSQPTSNRQGPTGTYVVMLSQSEVPAGQGNNWGSFQLSLRNGRFRMSDQRPAGDLVQGASQGFSAGTYAIQGDRIIFTVHTATGDTPIGKQGDQPVICRWSLYRKELTFRQLPAAAQARATARGLDAGGPPALYVKPWQRGTATKPAAAATAAKIVGTWFVNITESEKKANGLINWGPTRLVFGAKSFRISDRRAKGQPLVQGSSSGWTSGTFLIRGNRLTFFISNGSGDTPLGVRGDTPIVVRWSVYRNTLTLQQGKKNEGGAGLWLKPWRRVS